MDQLSLIGSLLVLTLMPPIASAETIRDEFSVSPLEECDNWNAAVLKESPGIRYEKGKITGNPGTECLLRFVDDKDPEMFEKNAEVVINNKVVSIHRKDFRSTNGNTDKKYPSVGVTQYFEFISDDKKLSVVLSSRVVTSSCDVDAESCCGDNYVGTLTFFKNGVEKSYRIAYYRGG